MKAHVPVYRKLLTRALKATWHHRGLWFFGFFAGLVQTGAVTNDVLRLAPLLETSNTLSWRSLEGWWANVVWGKDLVVKLFTATTQEVALAVICVIAAIIGATLLVITAQHILLMSAHRAAANKKPLHWREISQELRSIHVWRLLGINALSKIATLIVLLGGSFLLHRIIAGVPEVGVIATLAVYLVILPTAFAVSAVAMMSLIHATRDNSGIFRALHASIGFISTHWLATLEFAAILFLVNFAFTGVLVVGLVFLAQLIIALFTASVTSAGTIAVFFGIFAALTVGFIVMVSGCMTTFNYCSWNGFVEKYAKSPVHPRIEHAAAWLRKALVR